MGYRFFLPAVIPFLTAIFLAGWLYPAAVRVEKKTGIKRGITGTVLLTFVFMAVGILVYWCIRGALGQIQAAIENIPALLKTAEGMLDSCCGVLEEITGYSGTETKKYIMEESGNIMEVFLSALTPENMEKILGMAKYGDFFYFRTCCDLYFGVLHYGRYGKYSEKNQGVFLAHWNQKGVSQIKRDYCRLF